MVHSGLKRSGKLDIVKISGLPVRDFFPDNKRNDTTELDVGPSRYLWQGKLIYVAVLVGRKLNETILHIQPNYFILPCKIAKLQ